MRDLIAQKEIFKSEPFKGIGPLGLENKSSGDAPQIFNKFISGTIGLMTIIAAIWFIFVFITGAVGIISSGGDKAALETARKKITSGLIGLVVVVAAVFTIELIGWLIGFDLILNPAEFVINFTPGA
jgi:hypothetical protein